MCFKNKKVLLIEIVAGRSGQQQMHSQVQNPNAVYSQFCGGKLWSLEWTPAQWSKPNYSHYLVLHTIVGWRKKSCHVQIRKDLEKYK